MLGILPLFDPPRVDSKETIARAKRYGVSVKMVTGDSAAIASEIAGQLGMGTHIQPATDLFTGDVTKGQIPLDAAAKVEKAEGFAQVFPEHKYAIVKALQELGHIVGMTGDGVNDAPALKQADVGIAVSGATDAARAAAALILTDPGFSVIIEGIEEARRIFARMTSYTLYRIAMTTDIMFFIVLATIAYGFFPLTPIMIIALALLDDLPIMTIAFDDVPVAPKPVRWDMPRVLTISSILGFLAVVQSFGLMYIGDTIWQVDRAHLQTMMFLQLVAGGHLMLFLTRTPGAVLEAALSGPQTVLGHRRHAGFCGVDVRLRLGSAGPALEPDRFGLGIQPRVDDSTGRRQTGCLQGVELPGREPYPISQASQSGCGPTRDFASAVRHKGDTRGFEREEIQFPPVH